MKWNYHNEAVLEAIDYISKSVSTVLEIINELSDDINTLGELYNNKVNNEGNDLW